MDERNQELKLYMPLTVRTWLIENEYGEMEDGGELFDIDTSILRGNTDLLNEKMELYADPRDFSQEFESHGLMAYFQSDCNSALAEKVTRLDFAFEEVDGEMYGVAKCQICDSLTQTELAELKEYVTGQASDGLGEGFEQRDIKLDDIEVNVSLWNSEEWFLKSGEEMGFDEPLHEMNGMT